MYSYGFCYASCRLDDKKMIITLMGTGGTFWQTKHGKCRKWHFSNNYLFHEEAQKRSSNHSSFSLRKTSQPSPSSSPLPLGLHNSNSANLSGWTVGMRLLSHSSSWSCFQVGLTTLQPLSLTPCNSQVRELLMHIISVCTAPCGNWTCEKCFLMISSSSLVGGFLLLVAEQVQFVHDEK